MLNSIERVAAIAENLGTFLNLVSLVGRGLNALRKTKNATDIKPPDNDRKENVEVTNKPKPSHTFTSVVKNGFFDLSKNVVGSIVYIAYQIVRIGIYCMACLRLFEVVQTAIQYADKYIKRTVAVTKDASDLIAELRTANVDIETKTQSSSPTSENTGDDEEATFEPDCNIKELKLKAEHFAKEFNTLTDKCRDAEEQFSKFTKHIEKIEHKKKIADRKALEKRTKLCK